MTKKTIFKEVINVTKLSQKKQLKQDLYSAKVRGTPAETIETSAAQQRDILIEITRSH